MTNRIVFATNKGGAGKTTSTAMCAEVLAAAGYKVLAVDFDSQGNLTRILTGDSIYKFSGKTVMEAVMEGSAEPYIVNIKDNLDLIPAEDRLAVFSRHVYTTKVNNPYAVLKRLLEPVESRYDYVFIDVGPTLGDTVINAIVYADHIIIPVDGGDLALDAMVRFIDFVDTTRQEGHTNAEVLGIVLTMRDRRSRYERDVVSALRQTYGDLVFDTEIGRKVKIKEMSALGIDVEEPSIEEHIALTEEIIKRIGGNE